MRWFSTDYLRDRHESRPGTLLNRGFWLHDIPRLIPWCRMAGHRPVVDGNEDIGTVKPATRWVCCDRCGVRPEPQGRLDPAEHRIGDPYTGPWAPALPAGGPERREAVLALKHADHYAPGPWPDKPTGEFGGQVILGRTFGGVGAGVTVGHAGGERTVAAHIRLHHLGALYVHLQHHGTWLRRRLNPTGSEPRVTEFCVGDNGLRWKIWAKSNEWTKDTPRWQDGSVCLDPREWLWGPQRTRFEHVGDPEHAVVRMPHGDDHEVVLQLQRCVTERPLGGPRSRSWVVDWDCADGIPCRHDQPWKGNAVHGSNVEVSDFSVEEGTWPLEATTAIAAQMTRDRSRYGYRPDVTT